MRKRWDEFDDHVGIGLVNRLVSSSPRMRNNGHVCGVHLVVESAGGRRIDRRPVQVHLIRRKGVQAEDSFEARSGSRSAKVRRGRSWRAPVGGPAGDANAMTLPRLSSRSHQASRDSRFTSGLSCIGLVTTLSEVVEDGLGVVGDAWWGGDLLVAEADGGCSQRP